MGRNRVPGAMEICHPYESGQVAPFSAKMVAGLVLVGLKKETAQLSRQEDVQPSGWNKNSTQIGLKNKRNF